MPVQQARARSRQQRILRAAASVFARTGFREAAVDDIAKQAETSKGGLYFHFPGKEAILFALLDHTAGLLRRKVLAAMATEQDPVAKAEAALGVLLRTFARHRTLARVFVVEAMGAGPPFNEKVTAILDEFVVLIQEQLDEAVAQDVIEPVDTVITAQAWVGVLQAVIIRWVTSKDRRPPEEIYPTLRLLLLRSIGAGERAAETQREKERTTA